MATFGAVSSSTTLQRGICIPRAGMTAGSPPATADTVASGGTPQASAWLFDAAGESVTCYVTMPADWDKSQNVTLEIAWSLISAETDADTLDATVDYVVIRKNTTGAGVAKTSTQLSLTTTVTTANGLAAGDIYVMTGTIAPGDSNNGFSNGDNSIGIAFEIELANTVGVASAHLLDVNLSYQAKY